MRRDNNFAIRFIFFSCYSAAHHPSLHSFPTRRSSDLASGGRSETTANIGYQPQAADLLLTISALVLPVVEDRKSTRLNSSHQIISYAVFCLKKKNRRDDLRASAANRTQEAEQDQGNQA